MTHLLSRVHRGIFTQGHHFRTVVDTCKQINSVTDTVPVYELKSVKSLHCFGNVRYAKNRMVRVSPVMTKLEEEALRKAKRIRIGAYIAGFVSLQLGVILGRSYYKKQNKERKAAKEPITQEYVDPILGKTAKMFHYKGYLLPFFVKENIQAIDFFKVREDDVFVSSFPKSGTTWMQEIVYFIERGPEAPQEENMEQRFPFLEFPYPGIENISRRKGQRLIKTHVPYPMLPLEARYGVGKVIYIARNPKDVSVSYYHYFRMFSEVSFNGTFMEFYSRFVSDKVPYGPWWKHVRDYWDSRDNPNMLFITYEELQQDLPGSVERVAHFLGRTLTADQAAAVAKRCSFKAMQKNPASNYSWWDDLGLRRKGEADFMRKGIVGDWQNYYTPEMTQNVDKICENKLGRRKLHLVDKLK